MKSIYRNAFYSGYKFFKKAFSSQIIGALGGYLLVSWFLYSIIGAPLSKIYNTIISNYKMTFNGQELEPNKWDAYIFIYIALLAVNYPFFLYKDKYKKIVERFSDETKEQARKSNKIVLVCFLASIVLFVLWLMLFDVVSIW